MRIVSDLQRDGETLRDAARSLLRTHYAVLVRRNQTAFVGLHLNTCSATSVIVRALVMIPPKMDSRVVGAAVRALCTDDPQIISIGQAKSRRPLSHARMLDPWAIRDRDAVTDWLPTHPERSSSTDDAHSNDIAPAQMEDASAD